MLGAFNVHRRAVEFDPAFARSRLDAQFGFERREIARLMIEQLLREPRVFKMKRFGGHGFYSRKVAANWILNAATIFSCVAFTSTSVNVLSAAR